MNYPIIQEPLEAWYYTLAPIGSGWARFRTPELANRFCKIMRQRIATRQEVHERALSLGLTAFTSDDET